MVDMCTKVGVRMAQILSEFYWEMCDVSCPNCSGRTGGWLQMNRLCFRNNRLKVETSGELPIILEESIDEYTLNE